MLELLYYLGFLFCSFGDNEIKLVHLEQIKALNPVIISDTLCEGDFVDFTYKIVNQSSDTVFIRRVNSSCGCYVPTWPKKPILPSDTVLITGRYSSRGRPGPFRRSLTVFFSDTELPTMLRVSGFTKYIQDCNPSAQFRR